MIIHIVDGDAAGLRQIAKHRVIVVFVHVPAANQELLADQRHVARHLGTPPHELLAAGISESNGMHAQQFLDLCVGLVKLLGHPLQGVVLQGVLTRPREVSRTRMADAMTPDLMPAGHRALPTVQPCLDRGRVHKEGHLDAGWVYDVQALINLAGAPVIERQAYGDALSLRPVKRLRGSLGSGIRQGLIPYRRSGHQ